MFTSKPHAVQVVKVNDANGPKFSLNESELFKILLSEPVKDCYVSIISVTGALRKGKSFLLNFFLRYLNVRYNLNQNTPGWIGFEDEPLKGFSWKGGSSIDTVGIQMWSDVFISTSSTEKVAIILLDTQGAFDSSSTVKDCATIFAMSSLVSSVQIYNVSQNIMETDLQHLHLFTDYGRLAMEENKSVAFQKLQILVRDWSYPYEASYGEEGGMKVLNKVLAIRSEQHEELKVVRKYLKSCFKEISCFLLPHPGLKVATNPNFDGKLRDISEEFKEHLQVLVPMLLAPEKLKIKEINGEKVKAKDMVQYFVTYMKIFSGDELPEPKTIFVATAEANNLSAVAEALDCYKKKMDEICGSYKNYITPEDLEVEHLRNKEIALAMFTARKKLGGDEFSKPYRADLCNNIERAYTQLKAFNESKNILRIIGAPAIFICMSLLFYMFALISCKDFVASVLNNISIFFLFLLGIWCYTKYNSQYAYVGSRIDRLALTIWAYKMMIVTFVVMIVITNYLLIFL